MVLLGDGANGDALCWDDELGDWLRASPWGGFAVQSEPTAPRSYNPLKAHPTTEDVEAADSLVAKLERDRVCQSCGEGALPLHGIAPDVFGEPRLVCLLRPDPTVVSSYGGGGRTKHWGSPFACNSVRRTRITSAYDRAGRYGHHLFGEPLTALDVFSMRWCSKCESTAANIASHRRSALSDELGRAPTDEELSSDPRAYAHEAMRAHEISLLLEQMGDRSRADLIAEMRGKSQR